MLLKIAKEVPREMQGILACCNPVPPLVKQNLGLLHTVILNARERQVVTVETTGATGGERDALPEVPDVLENPLASPLDLAHLHAQDKSPRRPRCIARPHMRACPATWLLPLAVLLPRSRLHVAQRWRCPLFS